MCCSVLCCYLDATLNSWPAADITPLGLSVICQELPINNRQKRLAIKKKNSVFEKLCIMHRVVAGDFLLYTKAHIEAY